LRRIKDSKYWAQLLDNYARNPSIALCRVPELELLTEIELKGPVLDHCCGDGYIAEHAYPGRQLDAGIDLRDKALAVARRRGTYMNVQQADASRRLPFDTASFGTVINNSAIEHIDKLDQVVAEVARVLRPGGRFYFNVLNARFFEWWPLDAEAQQAYRQFQPFLHALNESEWQAVLLRHGFQEVDFREYMPRETAQVLAEYDYLFSAFYLRHRMSWRVLRTLVTPVSVLKSRWQALFGDLVWDASRGQGAGFRVSATRCSP
jgi:SAM-dependent methyltransferase